MTRMTLRWFAFLCGAILVLLGASLTHAKTAQEIARKAFDSTVLIVMEDANGRPLSFGSGFFVRDAEIASNLHVIKGAARGYVKLIGDKSKYDIVGTTMIDEEMGLALLKISFSRSQSLSLGNSDSVQVGEPVYAVGNQQSLEGTFSQGIIHSIRNIGADKLLLITAPISPASSGGPVLNREGEVIGISVATFKGGQNLNFAIPSSHLKLFATSKGGQDLNLAIPSSYLKSLLVLSKATPVKPLAQTKPANTNRSVLAGFGGQISEGVTGGGLTYDSFDGDGRYSFSLINKLREPVHKVHCIVAFYDKIGNPIDIQEVRYSDVIPGEFAKRIKGRVDPSVERLNSTWKGIDYSSNSYKKYGISTVYLPPPRMPVGRIDFRILDFEIAN